ncbi:hypothetical protein D3C80_1711350 [compost metagenome]
MATVEARTGDCAVLHHHGAAVPTEVAEHRVGLGKRLEAIRWADPAADFHADGSDVLSAAGAGAHAVPHRVCGQRLPGLGSGVELATA